MTRPETATVVGCLGKATEGLGYGGKAMETIGYGGEGRIGVGVFRPSVEMALGRNSG